MSEKENMPGGRDLDDVLEQAEQWLGITPAGKVLQHPIMSLDRYCV
jgi:uncharacterized protein with NRDE domain